MSIGIIKEKLPYLLIFDKKTVKRSKNEEINIKNSQKLTKKSRIIANFQLDTHFHALQNTVVSISGVDISI